MEMNRDLCVYFDRPLGNFNDKIWLLKFISKKYTNFRWIFCKVLFPPAKCNCNGYTLWILQRLHLRQLPGIPVSLLHSKAIPPAVYYYTSSGNKLKPTKSYETEPNQHARKFCFISGDISWSCIRSRTEDS